ncbi:MAG: sigma-70 family RNA polymerase sigma factor [Thermodesulfobacteriota bacterium]
MSESPAPVDPQNHTMVDDDAVFVARCRRGDTEAFSVLVRRHQKKMLNIAYRIIGDYDQSCDVVQEAFLSAYRAIGKFRGEARFSTWLCGIVMNHARTHLARRSARSRREGPSLDDHNKLEEDDIRQGSPCGDGPLADQIEKRQVEAKVRECIGLLPGDQREVLVLRDIQGFSYEEIGEILGLPEGTVKSRLFRARNDLKERLSGVIGDLL